jgi:hypothetical protein
MRRFAAALLACSLAACGGDTTPLPPLSVGPQWMPVMLDTTGNVVMRRMAIWVDTANVTTSAGGYALTSQKMQMDMKIGGMSTSMQMRTEVDCGGKRHRVVRMDSMTASMKGVPMPDSVARQAMAQQTAKGADSTWQESGAMFNGGCAKVANAVAAPAAATPAAPATAP